MFISMLFGMRVLLELLTKGDRSEYLAKVVTISILIGGLILGPIVQKYAFGAYWTGWPFGHDLTDNKTLIAFIVWVIAFFVLRKNPKNRFWPVFAALITLLVFAVPHSMFGSEFDYAAGEVTTGR
jgi:ABC-type transport system involved in cytochrome c biogenesis permease subunit